MQFKFELTNNAIKELKEMYPDCKEGFLKGMKKAMYYAESKIKRNFGKPNVPKVRTGHLRRSIQSGVRVKGNDIEGFVGSNLKYAGVHEFGGIIKPKNGEYLMFMLDGQFRKVKQVVIPERSYIRTGIENNIGSITSLVKQEIINSINNG